MPRQLPFGIRFAPEAVRHVALIEPKHHSFLQRTIHEQLRYQPEVATRNRKPLDQPAPFNATWELRCGPQNSFRIFYEINVLARSVTVLAVGIKERNRLFIGGEEFTP